MKFLPLIVVMIVSACACKQIKYEPDLGFMNSAQANSMEYLVRINGSACKDMDGQVGLCAKRIPSNAPIEFKMDGREYGYRFTLTCTRTIDSDFSVDVLPEQPLTFSIPPEKFSEVRSFTCIGEVFPHDRDQEISTGWHARFVVYDGKYQPREEIYSTTIKKENHLVLGKHARYVHVNGRMYKKATTVESEKDVQAYSESERGRFNYYGY